MLDDGNNRTTCEDIFNELELDTDADRQISTLESLRSAGFCGTLISIIATLAFLIDEHSKITSKKKDKKDNVINDAQGNPIYDKLQTHEEGFTIAGIAVPRSMEQKTLFKIWIAAIIIIVVQAFFAIILGGITSDQIIKARKAKDRINQVINQREYYCIVGIIFIFDILLEVILVALSYILFTYTDYETEAGILCAIFSSFLNFLVTCCDLCEYRSLYKYTK